MSDFPEGEFKFLMIARLLGDKGVREYVEAFLRAGINVYIGTDDPGFLGTSLSQESRVLTGIERQVI